MKRYRNTTLSAERFHEVASMMAIAASLKPTEQQKREIERIVENIPRKERDRISAQVRIAKRMISEGSRDA